MVIAGIGSVSTRCGPDSRGFLQPHIRPGSSSGLPSSRSVTSGGTLLLLGRGLRGKSRFIVFITAFV
ncbi:MAG: hypothetical protein CMJ54_02270 [Planctomycetaceae bacterium]|nr:hypothetical protein [Planctomycetaceae bacterium]